MTTIINKLLDSKLDIHAFDVCTGVKIREVLYEYMPHVNTQEVMFVLNREQADKVSLTEWKHMPNVMLSRNCVAYVKYIFPKNLFFFREEDLEALKEALK